MESNLVLRKSDLEKEIGTFIGWGDGDPDVDRAWTAREIRELKKMREKGEMRVLQPSPYYAWSFLNLSLDLTFATGATTVDLPDDFAGLTYQITVADADSGFFPPIPVVNKARIAVMYAGAPTTTGRPQFAAIRNKKTDGGVALELYVFPAADVDYTLTVQYNVTPRASSDEHPVVFGGAECRQVFLEACLAEAEKFNSQPAGDHEMAFQRALMSAIQMDQQRKNAQSFGLNLDRSDNESEGYYESFPVATINSIEYS